MEKEELPQYCRVAFHLASRIAQGDIPVGQRLSGRSKLSSEYGVSPETVRRAMKLLADMKVVEIKEQSGILVLSADNARRYCQENEIKEEGKSQENRMRELMEQQYQIARQMMELWGHMLREQSYQTAERLPNYAVRVSTASDKIGKSLASLQFWGATGATIVAIRRGNHLLVSPGPNAELYGGDQVIFVGTPDVVEKVVILLNGKGEYEQTS